MKKLFLSIVLVLMVSTILSSSKIILSDEPSNNWLTQPSLPYTLASHQTVTHDNHFYVIGGGGTDDVYHSDILMSSIGADGNLSSWHTISNLPIPMIWHSVSVSGDKIFVLGGASNIPGDGLVSLDTVYTAIINSDGTITPWRETTPLPEKLALGGSFVFNNHIYYVGGTVRAPHNSQGVISSAIYTAEILPNGDLGEWQAISPLPAPRSEVVLLLKDNRVSIFGGLLSNLSASDDFLSSTLNLDGTLTPWIKYSHLPTPIRRPAVTFINGYYLMVGGYDGSQFTNKIYYSYSGLDNLPESWHVSSKNLPTLNCCNSLTTGSSFIYLVGGSGPNYFSTVYKSTFSDLIASPTPTIAPTATPTVLTVPDVKQYTLPWSKQIYDTANQWSNSPTIQRWGCALTSASMILKYYGHNINPDALNNWLKSQSDGYIKDGLLNWIAISRYTKLHSTTTLPSLEFNRYPSDINKLRNEINSGRPAIVNPPNHFVVTTGINDSDFYINDPATTHNLLSFYPSFSNIYTFTPSHTDLSYIMLVTDPKTTLKVYNSNNEEVGESYFQSPIVDDISMTLKSGTGSNIYYFAKPPTGNYKVQSFGTNGFYHLDSYIYDSAGNVKKQGFTGLTTTNAHDEFLITTGTKPNTKPVINYDYLVLILDDLFNHKHIHDKTFYLNMRYYFLLAKNFHNKWFLETCINLMRKTNTKIIDNDSTQFLTSEINSL